MKKNNSKNKVRLVDYLSPVDKWEAIAITMSIQSSKSIEEILSLDMKLQRLIAKAELNRDAYKKAAKKRKALESSALREEILKKYINKKMSESNERMSEENERTQ